MSIIPTPEDDKLILYYNNYSFYAQKVLMALYEKHIPFESHVMDISKWEQYDEWFLKINPLGEIPVLQDGKRYVTDSTNIVTYLDLYYTDDKNLRLIPLEENTLQKEAHFRALVDKLPAAVLTLGSFYHRQLTHQPKIPFSIPSVRRALQDSDKKNANLLFDKAEEFPEYRSQLIKKAHYLSNRQRIMSNVNDFLVIIKKFHDVLDQVEAELATHTGARDNWWLVTENFTLADICLTVLLERLNNIGMEDRFWANGKRPHIEKYFGRVRRRASYRKSMPTLLMHSQLVFGDYGPFYLIGGSATTVILTSLVTYLIYKKFKH